jgi:tetratricopeptide (TPR) repeat protein
MMVAMTQGERELIPIIGYSESNEQGGLERVLERNIAASRAPRATVYGTMMAGAVAMQESDLDRAGALLEQARVGVDAQLAARPGDPQVQVLASWVYEECGKLAEAGGRWEDVLAHTGLSVRLQEGVIKRTAKDAPAAVVGRRTLDGQYKRLGVACTHLNRSEEAVGYYRQRVELADQVCEASPEGRTAEEYTRCRAYARVELANAMLTSQGEPTRIQAVLEEAEKVFHQLREQQIEDEYTAHYRAHLDYALARAVDRDNVSPDRDRRLSAWRRAIETMRSAHDQMGAASPFAAPLHNAALRYRDAAVAAGSWGDILAACERILNWRPAQVDYALWKIYYTAGAACWNLGRREGARRHWRSALEADAPWEVREKVQSLLGDAGAQ